MRKLKHKLNLTDDEFIACVELYEKSTGSYWLPTYCREQDFWIRGFEEAKNYFGVDNT